MKRTPRMAVLLSIVVLGSMSFSSGPVAAAPTGGEPPAGNGAPARLETATPAPSSGAEMPAGAAVAPPVPSDALVAGWPVNLSSPGAGFPYTPTLFDVDGDGAEEIFLTGGNTFGLKGDGTFLPGWPTTEHQYMGYGTNDQKSLTVRKVLELCRDLISETAV
ncbi:MAG TPA: hypothetical protein PLV66_14490, partial [Thermoanaerobaculales bacterium]|nr:hypothetical protein [Thermoanaerobaculales bacterium]